MINVRASIRSLANIYSCTEAEALEGDKARQIFILPRLVICEMVFENVDINTVARKAPIQIQAIILAVSIFSDLAAVRSMLTDAG